MQNFVLLAYDHAKKMRNAVVNIDIPTRTADGRFNVHSIMDYINKWQGGEYDSDEHSIRVHVQSNFQGNISIRCLEASAIDRILYNYINKAIGFADSQSIVQTIFLVGDQEHQSLRWVVENRISHNHQQWLKENVGETLHKLFEGGIITRGGNGLGLSNCVDFVSSGYGITAKRALDEGYIGAKVIDDTYYAWFHWNIV